MNTGVHRGMLGKCVCGLLSTTETAWTSRYRR
jgi:hypothetical protein